MVNYWTQDKRSIRAPRRRSMLEEENYKALWRMQEEFDGKKLNAAYALTLRAANVKYADLEDVLLHIFGCVYRHNYAFLFEPQAHGRYRYMTCALSRSADWLFKAYSALSVYMRELFYSLVDAFFACPGFTKTFMVIVGYNQDAK